LSPLAVPDGLALTDGVRRSAASYRPGFPYLNTPLPGSP
jgi:hypothetical protein